MDYWNDITFTKKEAQLNWIEKNGHLYQWEEIFINNGYGITCRKLRII